MYGTKLGKEGILLVDTHVPDFTTACNMSNIDCEIRSHSVLSLVFQQDTIHIWLDLISLSTNRLSPPE